MRTWRLCIAACLAVVGLWGMALAQSGAPGSSGPVPSGPVVVAAIEGAIGPAATRHVEQALAHAAERRAEAVVLRLNTPGGLLTSTRDITAAILASPIPVVGWVAPSGAHAASAGTFILYATHVAAMAPGTNIGAASPVGLGGSGDEEASKTLENKATNDAVAFIRSLAEVHGRNADWAEKAVREAATLTAPNALRDGVVDIVAADLDGLLGALDGRRVGSGKVDRTVSTAGAPVETFEPDTLTRLLSLLADPNVALVLMMVGVYGLIFEFANPGGIGPGIVGAICLILGLYALNQLPLNAAGLVLLLLGLGLMIAEAFTPTLGVLGVGGAIAFVIGGGMLMDTDAPQFQVSWPLLIAAAGLSLAFALFLLGAVWRAHRNPVRAGREDLIGASAEVLDWTDGSGHVRLHGERWRANSDTPLAPGAIVRVRTVEGLTVTVTLEQKAPPP